MPRQWQLPGGPYLNADDTGRDWLIGGVQIAAAPAVTDQTITPSGIASGFAAGAHIVLAPLTVAPAGIASAGAFGAHAVIHTIDLIAPSGIPSGFAAGTAILLAHGLLLPAGIPSAFAAGTAILAPATIFPGSIPSGEIVSGGTVVQRECHCLDIENDVGTILILGIGPFPCQCLPQPFEPILSADSEGRSVIVPVQNNLVQWLENDAHEDLEVVSDDGETLAVVTTGLILSKHDTAIYGHYLGWTIRGEDTPYRIETIEMEYAATRAWEAP